MKSDNAIRNSTSIFVGIIVAIAAFVRGALLLPLLLVACSVWGLYVLQHLRGSLTAVPKKKAKAPRRAKFVVVNNGFCVDTCTTTISHLQLYSRRSIIAMRRWSDEKDDLSRLESHY